MENDQQLVDEAAEEAARKAAAAARHGPQAVARVVREEVRGALHRHPQELMAGHTLTFGERWAGYVARASGNWKSIIPYLLFTAAYLIVNHWIIAFDLTLQYYTFAVSVLAIFLAQVILLFQNRQSDLESALAHNAYDQTSEIFTMQQQQVEILEAIQNAVHHSDELLRKLDDMMIDVHTIIHTLGATAATAEPEGMPSP